MFRLQNSHTQADVEYCSVTKIAHSVGSHFVYIHKIGHIIVKLA